MKPDKAAVKALRQERKEQVDRARALSKQRNKMMRAVQGALDDAGKTVPELADQLDMPAADVLWCVSGLRKYGKALEGDKDGDYFKYTAVPEKEAS
jgi:hypothetical protein